jgi:hypothetical protein
MDLVKAKKGLKEVRESRNSAEESPEKTTNAASAGESNPFKIKTEGVDESSSDSDKHSDSSDEELNRVEVAANDD